MKTGQDAVAKQIESTLKNVTDHIGKAADINKNNLDALTQCSTILARGMEEMSRNMVGWMQNTMEQSMTAGKQMLTVKTLRDLVDLQTSFMRGFLDQSMTETTKISEISTRMANQALEPINQRVTEIVGTITQNQSRAA